MQNIGKILIVDDEKINAEAMKDTLEDVNYSVGLAFSAQEAKDIVAKEDFDLIILDVWMPGIDGLTLLRQFVAAGNKTPVVIMSGHGDIRTATDAIKAGAVDYLAKPLDNLLPTIRDIFANLQGENIHKKVVVNSFDMPIKEARNSFEKTYFLHHLQANNYNISKVSSIVQLERTTLYRKLKDLGIHKK